RRAAEPELQERITALEPDLLVVVDYGRPLPAELLGVAGRGAVELHGSLLPKLRGPHSLRAGLSAGDSKTGITAFLPNEEPWAGPILLQEELEIGEHETFVQLIPRAQELVREVVVQAVTKIDKSKKPKTRAQNEKSSTATSKISARHRRAPWHLNSSSVYGRLRAHAPHGLGAYCKIRPVDILRGLPMDWENAPNGEIGTYLGMRQGKLAVLCGEGTVFGITRICRPGDPPASASTFARQEGLRVGDRFI
ncbi:MAG: formyltransferase family protein, partial [Acidobacteriota bacterium]